MSADSWAEGPGGPIGSSRIQAQRELQTSKGVPFMNVQVPCTTFMLTGERLAFLVREFCTTVSYDELLKWLKD